jgi:hypothetical protein
VLWGGPRYHSARGRGPARRPPGQYFPSNAGVEAALAAYRHAVLRAAGLDPSAPRPARHRILLLRKGPSATDGAGGARRAIANLDAAAAWLGEAFPSLAARGDVAVFEPHTLSWRAQLAALQAATVLVTPCGGASTVLPFLPAGAAAIVADYPDPPTNASVSMEAALWAHVPHVRVLYYQMRGPDDWVWAAGGGDDGGGDGGPWRHGTAPVLGRARLVGLVRAAMRGMA